MAGNIAAGLVGQHSTASTYGEPAMLRRVAALSVALARAILAEIDEPEPVEEPARPWIPSRRDTLVVKGRLLRPLTTTELGRIASGAPPPPPVTHEGHLYWDDGPDPSTSRRGSATNESRK